MSDDAANIGTPSVDDDVLDVNLDHLTVGEMELIEELSDTPLTAFGDPNRRQAKLLRAFAMVIRRRTDPGFTWEQAGNLKVRMQAEQVPPNGDSG